MWKFRVWRSKLILLITSLVFLQCLVFAAIDEHATEWRDHQKKYARELAEKASKAGQPVVEFPIEIRQSYLENLDLKRVDRCTTCHVGIENPQFATAAQPLRAHPGNLLKHHPSSKFGCTICHQGQGRATKKEAAHGNVRFWDQPLLTGDFVQASCAKCHHDDPIPQSPVLSHGRKLMQTLGCVGCHQAGEIVAKDKVGPQLDAVGSKVSRKWLNKWLVNSGNYLPHGKMPHFGLSPPAADALAAFLMTQRDTTKDKNGKTIDEMKEPEGDSDVGKTVYREAQCIVCHVTKEDYEGEPLGGEIGPDLRKLGNKVNRRWLTAFFLNPHRFLPNTKMPRYHFSDKESRDLMEFALEEWVDLDLLDAEEKEPAPSADTPRKIEQGRKLFVELSCIGCHDLKSIKAKPTAPDLSYIGSRNVHTLDFGKAKVRRTLPDFLFTKLKSPHKLRRDFQRSGKENPAAPIWKHLRPTAMFSATETLPSGSDSTQLIWILRQTQQKGLLSTDAKLPSGSAAAQAEWLVRELNKAGGFSPLKMPDFHLSDEEAKALTIALMSLSERRVVSRRYEVARRPKAIFNPKDRFGELERRYRCLSCHKIRDSGDLLASDLTLEGSRVNEKWLYHFLNKPYSMRRTLTIAMPIFHFPDEDSKLMADYMSHVFADRSLEIAWDKQKEKSNVARGKKLFDQKGCIACHQLNGTGGDVGPSLTTQVPEFPHGTYVGDKLKGGWIFRWLKNPQAMLPDTIEPNLGLSNQQALDLTAFLLSVKNPEFQKKKSTKKKKTEKQGKGKP